MAEGWNDDSILRQYFDDIVDSTPLSREREVELAERIRQGDVDARDELIQANVRFVIDVAMKYQHRGLSLADLISAGNMGLMTAAERFDGTRGNKFITYAVWWIRQAILAALAEQARTVRLPLNKIALLKDIAKASRRLGQDGSEEPTAAEIAAELGVEEAEVEETMLDSRSVRSLDAAFDSTDERTLGEMLPDQGPSPDAAVAGLGLSEGIDAALASLVARERKIITLYYGIGREEALTLEQIGALIGVTRERVRQIKVRALRELRHPSRSAALRELDTGEPSVPRTARSVEKPVGSNGAPKKKKFNAKERGRAPKKQKAGKKAKPAASGKNGSPLPRQRVRRWTPAQIAARNAEEAARRAEAVGEAVIASIKRLRAKRGVPPTAEEVCADAGGQITPDQIPRIVQAYRERQRAAEAA